MQGLTSFLATVSFSELLDINFILINRLFVLAVTVIFFVAIYATRRLRGLEIHPRILAPVKLALFGFVLLYAELSLAGIPGYQSLLHGFQTIIVLLCLAKLANYLIIDIYIRIHTGREVPSFVRDIVRLVVYLLVGMISLRVVFNVDLSAILTTTTVITATIAFAMQSTLANALFGFSIQSNKLLARQNWISIKDKNIFGEIINVGFRYTTLRNQENYLIMVPNSLIIQNVVTFHGSRETVDKPAIQVDVMLGYDMPPETARELLLKVMRDEPLLLENPEPVVRLISLNDSGITYQLKFWIEDPSGKVAAQDSIYSQVWYAVNRAGYSFPFPHRQIVTSEAKQPFSFPQEQIAGNLRSSELFSMLDDNMITSLAGDSQVQVYGPGEIVVNQGDSGDSLFIVLKGSLSVSVDGCQVGTIEEDSFFGEMSLMTGEPRSATVRAVSEVWLAVVTNGQLEPLFKDNPQVLLALSAVLSEREERTKNRLDAVADPVAAVRRSEDYLKRLKHFFRL